MYNELINPRLTTKIVGSYVRHHVVGTDQLSELITSVHRTLGQLGKPVQVEESRAPAVPVQRSVHRDYVVCLECGLRARTLRRHISVRHGLSRVDYLRRWGLLSDHPLTAPAYSEERSSTAKALGLGRKARANIGPVTTPMRKRSTRSASKPAIVGEPAPFTRQRRSRSRATSTPAA